MVDAFGSVAYRGTGAGALRIRRATATGAQAYISGGAFSPALQAPTRPAKLKKQRRRWNAYTYSNVTTTNEFGRPVQTRTLVRNDEWGWEHMIVHGKGLSVHDVTFFRDAPAQLLSTEDANSFGWTTAVVRFAQISPYEEPGVDDLDWLRAGPKFDIRLVLPDGTVRSDPLFEGFIANRRPYFTDAEMGWEIDVKGFLQQGGDQRCRPRAYWPGHVIVDIGTRVVEQFNELVGRDFPRIAAKTTGIVTQKRGSLAQSRLEFADELLQEGWTSDARQWLLLPRWTRGRTAHLVLPDTDYDYLVRLGAEGFEFDELDESTDELPNVVYGEWTNPSGGHSQNVKYPRLHPDDAPAYPLAAGVVFTAGDGHTGFQPFSDWMRDNGFDVVSQDTYLAADVDEVERAQDEADITVDGVVGAQTWGTILGTGADVGSILDAKPYPLYAHPTVEPYKYNASGQIIGKNSRYDPTVRRIEVTLNLGEGVTRAQALRAAKQTVERNMNGVSLVGRATLRADVQDADGDPVHRADIHTGRILRVQDLFGSHVDFMLTRATRDFSDESLPVTLEMDTKARSAYTVTQIIERNKEERSDPARRFRRQASKLTSDTAIVFDADNGAGKIYTHTIQGGFWRVVEFPAGAYGTFVELIATTSPAAEFVLGLFEQPVTANFLAAQVGNPLDPINTRPFDTNRKVLADAGLRQAWGSGAQPGGYSDEFTGAKTDGDTLTGKIEDNASTDWASSSPPRLWLAEYSTSSTDITVTFKIAPDSTI